MKKPLQCITFYGGVSHRRIDEGSLFYTVRKGHRKYRLGECMLACHLSPWATKVEITSITHTTAKRIPVDVINHFGFDGNWLKFMSEHLEKHYPNVNPDTPVTIVKWRH
ncbi:MAG: hypothetical protein ACXACY_28670 [Candidatus Hodarchaeales archaeon]|jgi:hypothetical protein